MGKEEKKWKTFWINRPSGWNSRKARGLIASKLGRIRGERRGFSLVFHSILLMIDQRNRGYIFILREELLFFLSLLPWGMVVWTTTGGLVVGGWNILSCFRCGLCVLKGLFLLRRGTKGFGDRMVCYEQCNNWSSYQWSISSIKAWILLRNRYLRTGQNLVIVT
jgi:hypothetical protein